MMRWLVAASFIAAWVQAVLGDPVLSSASSHQRSARSRSYASLLPDGPETPSNLAEVLRRTQPVLDHRAPHAFLGLDKDLRASHGRTGASDSHEEVRHKLSQKDTLGILVFAGLLVLIISWLLRIVVRLHDEYESASKSLDELEWSFSDFLSYRFGLWISWTGKANMILLGTIAGLILPLGAGLYWLLVGHGIWHGAWLTFVWMVAPDGGIGETTVGGAFCGGVISLAGLVIFALLLTFLQDAFQEYMNVLKSGDSPVLEKGHVVIIGLSTEMIPLLDELTMAHEKCGGTAIVVLSESLSKPDMEAAIQDAGVEVRGSRIVVRTGHPQYQSDLEFVGVNTCKSVVIIADRSKDKEVRDAFVMQAVMLMRSQGWPEQGRILVECSLLTNRALLEKLGGPQMDIVMTDRWMARLFVQVSQQVGLGAVIADTFSFRGAELYLHAIPDHLIGKQFFEASLHYPDAVLVGTLSGYGDVTFGSLGRPGRALTVDDELILLAPSSSEGAAAKKAPICDIHSLNSMVGRIPSPRKHFTDDETIVIVGWGALLGPLLIELDHALPAQTRVIILSPMPLDKREPYLERTQRRWKHRFAKLKVDHVVGMLGSPSALERLPVNLTDVSRIFLLADHTAEDSRHADACTIAALMQFRQMLSQAHSTRCIPIIPEIKDPRSEQLCSICKVSDYINSSGMPNQVLASVSFQPRLRTVLREILSDETPIGFAIRTLQDYIQEGDELPTSISFVEAQAIIDSTGDVLLGWSRPDDHVDEASPIDHTMKDLISEANGPMMSVPWQFNPCEKMVQRAWSRNDHVVVFSSR
eukprot:TRINITY_DN8568_c0_g2_i1.p1 TRINITY_DN8568_c0_g2~~TRINITY_DN8568_c0_g2_i1.p1  ORF type:complete len:811 (+),score=81.59 TRINITY_DN8568_c0_g2_i1:63-2495(+)